MRDMTAGTPEWQEARDLLQTMASAQVRLYDAMTAIETFFDGTLELADDAEALAMGLDNPDEKVSDTFLDQIISEIIEGLDGEEQDGD